MLILGLIFIYIGIGIAYMRDMIVIIIRRYSNKVKKIGKGRMQFIWFLTSLIVTVIIWPGVLLSIYKVI